MTNKVNIDFLKTQLDKALKDIEDLKDKVRANEVTKRKLILFVNKFSLAWLALHDCHG